jgi:hypothetical protein
MKLPRLSLAIVRESLPAQSFFQGIYPNNSRASLIPQDLGDPCHGMDWCDCGNGNVRCCPQNSICHCPGGDRPPECW